MHNETLYRSLLRKFHAGQSDFVLSFRAAQSQGDATAPERLAHTLKSVAGSIGARAVQAAAAELERACRSHATAQQVDALVEGVAHALEPLLVGLAAALVAPAEPAPQAGAQDAHQLQVFTAKLVGLLGEGDPDSIELVAREPGLLAAAFPLQHAAIGQAIEGYDFEAALALIRQAQAGAGAPFSAA